MSESRPDAAVHGRVSLDQLIALNDEIIALTRAGMPLEQGLLDLGSDMPGGLRSITAAVGQRMSQGESLPEALERVEGGVPKLYRAVVEAGLRAGRLPVALEGLATFARGLAEARRSIGLAVWYPLIIITLAYVMFLFFAGIVVPRFVDAFTALGVPVHAFVRALAYAGAYTKYWGGVVPVLLLLFVLSWLVTSRASSLQGRNSYSLLRWFPWMGSMMRGFEAAGFAEMLSLLIENHVAYPDALVLAGDASGDPQMAAGTREMARGLELGEPLGRDWVGRNAFPPLLRWLLATGPKQADLVAALKQMALRYRSEARYQADKIRIYMPTILLFGFGATATFLYALTLFVPLASLWSGLAHEYS